MVAEPCLHHDGIFDLFEGCGMGMHWVTSPIVSCYLEYEIFKIRVMQTHRALVTTIKALSAGKIDHDFKHGPSGPHHQPAQHSRSGHAAPILTTRHGFGLRRKQHLHSLLQRPRGANIMLHQSQWIGLNIPMHDLRG